MKVLAHTENVSGTTQADILSVNSPAADTGVGLQNTELVKVGAVQLGGRQLLSLF